MYFPRIGGLELIVVLVIIMIIFGVGKLPKVAADIGKALREFRKGQAGEEDAAASSKEKSKSEKAVTKSDES